MGSILMRQINNQGGLIGGLLNKEIKEEDLLQWLTLQLLFISCKSRELQT
jgi:hypothetical protein